MQYNLILKQWNVKLLVFLPLVLQIFDIFKFNLTTIIQSNIEIYTRTYTERDIYLIKYLKCKYFK